LPLNLSIISLIRFWNSFFTILFTSVFVLKMFHWNKRLF
jgi:hypothetical protein